MLPAEIAQSSNIKSLCVPYTISTPLPNLEILEQNGHYGFGVDIIENKSQFPNLERLILINQSKRTAEEWYWYDLHPDDRGHQQLPTHLRDEKNYTLNFLKIVVSTTYPKSDLISHSDSDELKAHIQKA